MPRFQWFFGSLRCEQLGTNQSSRRRKDAENSGWSDSQPWEAVEQSRGGVEPYASLTVRTWTLSPTSSFRHVDKFLNATGGSFTVVRSSGLWAEESTRAALPSLEKSAREATGPGRALPVQLPWKPLSLQRF